MRRIFYVLVLTFFSFQANSQRIVSYSLAPAGHTFSTEGTRGVWSIGSITEAVRNTGTYIVNHNLLTSASNTRITALEEGNSDVKFLVYPNPARTSITIETVDGHDNLKYILYDSQGKQITVTKADNLGVTTINLAENEPGIYTLLIKPKNTTSFQKFRVVKI